MMTLIFILSIYWAEARVLDTNTNCNGIVVHNYIHEKEILKTNIEKPYQLSIDYDTNTLFFSYTNSLEGDGGYFKAAFINLKTNEYGEITDVSGAFATAVDHLSQTVYIGGNDGIYKYNYKKNDAEKMENSSDNIWQMFFKDRLYYTTYPYETPKVVIDGEPSLIPELANTKTLLVALDNKLNYWFSNSSGLYLYNKKTNETEMKGDYNLNAFTSDLNGNLYFSTPESIYHIDINKDVIDHLTKVEDLFGFVVEGDNNLIVADSNNIFRLKPTRTYCNVSVKQDFD